jgi:hypothetical protein
MQTNLDSLLPKAQDLRKRIALVEAEKAAAAMRKHSQEEAEKKSLLDHLSAPSGVSDEEALRRASAIIERAVGNGLNEVQVIRFPNALCTDHGRAINQQEPGWEQTLTGLPREMYELWTRHFRERGYRLRAQIIDFPDGMPGDVALTLAW